MYKIEITKDMITENISELQEVFDDIHLSDNMEPLVIDLSKVTRMDSTGVSLITACMKTFKNMTVAGCNPDVKSLLEVVGISLFIKVEGIL